MKINRLLFLLLIYSGGLFAQSNQWTTQPFEQKVFVENKGQFDQKVNDNANVLYGTTIGGLEIYFTSTSVIYKHNKSVRMTEAEAELLEGGKEKFNKKAQEEEHFKIVPEFVTMEWQGANAQVILTATNQVEHYYTYGGGKESQHLTNIKAKAFKKLIYQNIYPNIDIEYIIPKDSGGLKYSLILHPGADASLIQMKYSGIKNIKPDEQGNAVIKTKFGNFVDHAPITYFENKEPIVSGFSLKNNTISFNITSQQQRTANLELRTIIIDPWTTTPTFGANGNSAYDVNFDLQGNVYAYGSSSDYKLGKFNNTGAPQWIFTVIGSGYYGDFAVDEKSQSSYIVIGGLIMNGAFAVKVSPTGTQVGLSPQDTLMNEMHRAEYNRCINKIVIGGGGTSSHYQAAMLDTTLSTLNIVDIVNTTQPTHDIALLKMDNTGKYCYMLPGYASGEPAKFDNYLIKCPVPTLTPSIFSIPTGHNLAEVTSTTYVSGNGYNGIAVSPKWVYTYDNDKLKRWNKNTGAAISTTDVTPFSSAYYGRSFNGIQLDWGGLDADECDNIYVGVNDSVKIYNTNLAFVTGYKMSGKVYDLKLGLNNKLYVCGQNFVSELNIAAISNPLITAQTPSCGSCNGTAFVSPTCGGDPSSFTYSWSTSPIQTTQTATGLCPGTYSVTLSTSCISSYDTVVTVNSGSPITITTSVTNTTCANNDGVANANITGGTSVYSYSWSNGQTTQNISGLSSGIYTLTAADANGCTQTQTVEIKQPVDMTLAVTTVNADCNSGNGTATATAAGGISAYTYSWSTVNQNTQTATGLSAGVYTVTATDANGCTKTQTVKITGNITLQGNAFSTACNTSNGYVFVQATNGSAPYTYSWSGTTQSTSFASNLAAGVYTVSVNDASGCSGTLSLEVLAATNMSVSFNSANTSCGSNTGSATANVSGGTNPYTFSWSNSATTSTISNLAANTYTVTVSDAQQCTKTATVIISQTGNTLNVSMGHTDISCSTSSNGTATATTTLGSSPYTYSWSSGVTQTTASVTGLNAGTYTVTVSDKNNCTLTKTVVITAAAAISFTATPSNASCGSNNGSITTSVSGGATPYTYSWSGGITSTTSSASGLAAGSYSILITDATNCTQSASVTINNSGGANTNVTSLNNISCNGLTNGSASVTVTGGTTPYTYSWSTITNATSSATNLAAGVYTVTVLDGKNCQSTVTVDIKEPTAITITPGAIVDANCGAADGSANISASGGTTPFSYSWNTNQTTSNLTGVSSGTYTITVTDKANCTKSNTININNVGGATLSMLSNPPTTCYGGADGSGAISIVSGGTAPFSYSWSGGVTSTTSSASGLTSGNYTITVKDANNCQSTISINISQPANITTTFNKADAACNGIDDGSVTASATGGNGNSYTYSWNTNETTAFIDSLSPSTYTVIVTDTKNCTKSATITIGVMGGPSVYAGLDSTIALGSSIQLNASNGGNTYLWSPPTGLSCTACQNPIAAPTVDTWYVVTMTDSKGCVDQDSLFITVETPCGDIFIPTAFSPNDDGINDLFRVRGKCMKEFLLQVFNRWGEIVFETNDISKGWNGIFRGQLENSAVFIFVLKGKTTKGDEIYKKGNVTLIR